MYFLKSILSPRSRSEQENRVNEIFETAQVSGKNTLHPNYLKIFNHSLSKASDPNKCLKLLISKLETLTSLEEIVKCFTLIHSLIISSNYQGQIIECIENAEVIVNRQLKLEGEEKYEAWFIPFYSAYVRYLVKISSNAQILVRATQQAPLMEPNIYLNDLFRLVNQLNIILMPLNATTKIVGRYYSKTLKVFQELYNVLQSQLLTIYKYFRVLIDAILKNFKELSLIQLQTFSISIPEYQLMLDKLQDLLMCKYFRGKCKEGQPHVWAEDIAKINYQIACRKKEKESPKTRQITTAKTKINDIRSSVFD